MIFRWSSDSPLISFVELQTCHEAQESHWDMEIPRLACHPGNL